MMTLDRRLLLLTIAGTMSCVSARPGMRNGGGSAPAAASDRPCSACGASLPDSEVTLVVRPVPSAPDSAITRAIERRLSELKARGGHCSSYGAVLDTAYRSGQITIRPYMWRVGSQLASGEAKPNGELVLAREIDSLNVGVRTVDDLLWTMEHEAAHIAFKITNGVDAEADRANEYVRACK